MSTIRQVRGVASYRERIALPPDAIFEASLEDVSRANARPNVIGRSRLEPAGQPPFRFAIDYDGSKIEAGHEYTLRARVLNEGRLMFTTDRNYPLPRSDQPVELLLVRAPPREPSEPTASLVNTYWKLVRLGDQPVMVAEEQREPYVVLYSEEQRVGGYGGCNRLTGNYVLSEDTLTFSQVGTTMMACTEGMEHERAFLDALGNATRWRIEGETLELFDAAGQQVALLESRYLR